MDYHVALPELHPGQVDAYLKPGRFKAIRCGRRWGKCVAKGTLVTLADGGYSPIEELNVGDLVLSMDENGIIGPQAVQALVSNGERETIVVSTAARSITVTPNHPLMIDGKWTEAKFINVGSLAAVPKSLPNFGNAHKDETELDFIAIWLAEGSGYFLSNQTSEIIEVIQSIAAKWGLIADRKSSCDWYLKHNGQHGGLISRHPARLLLEREGLWGRDSKTKFIPEWVFRLSKSQLSRWLNLFMACDGSLSIRMHQTWAMEVGLANERMVRQLSDLFIKFGIRGQIRHKVHRKLNKFGDPFESWRFIVSERNSLLAFCQQIGMIGKERQIAKAIKSTEKSTGTCNRYYPIGYGELTHNYFGDRDRGYLDDTRSWRKQSTKRISEKKYKKFAHGLPVDWRVDGDISWEAIIAVEPGSAVETFDLTISGNANFFANNICSHNTKFATTIAMDTAIKGNPVGWFAPEWKFLAEPYQEILLTLGDLVRSSSESKGVINLKYGGHIDFWSLENPLAGRGRKYKLVIVDEAAFTKNGSMLASEASSKGMWEKNIRPTLVDLRGSAYALSNTNGDDSENFLWQICKQDKYGFVEYHAPSSDNPFLPVDELEDLRLNSMPLVWRQEYEAEFVDWSGIAFFKLDYLLQEGKPVAYPTNCDSIFVTIDSATKTGKENDGTAAIYWALTTHADSPLVILDYEIVQITGDLLISWLPGIMRRAEELSIQCGARFGFVGAHIEDKASGMILIMQAQNMNMNVHAIDSKLTSLGKSERAINVSSYVFQNKVRMSEHAYNKTVMYKGVTRNHLLSQVVGFRIGNKDQVDDDLLDCFTYSISLGVGNNEGY